MSDGHPEVLLSLHGVVKHFAQRGLRSRNSTRAVDGVSLALERGEIFGVAGESGCGKSTLARLGCGLLEPSQGKVHWRGSDIWSFTRAEWKGFRRKVQLVFQDPEASLNPRKTVSNIVGQPLRAHRLGDRRTRRKRVLGVLEKVQLSPAIDYLDKYPHELSGGAKQRVGIARALVLEPELLIADEPIASLDMSIRGEILRLLRDLNRELDLTILMVSHDLNVLQTMCSRLAVMYVGKVVETGEPRKLFSKPEHHYTHALLSLVSAPNPQIARERQKLTLKGEVPSASNPPSGCRFHTRCPHRVDLCMEVEPTLETRGSTHLAACHNPVQAVLNRFASAESKEAAASIDSESMDKDWQRGD